MSSSAAPVASVWPLAICVPLGWINTTLAPAPNAPKAGTTLILLTVGGVGVGGVGVGATGVGAAVVVEEEPPPQPAKNASGRAKVRSNLCIFMVIEI